ncbi:PIN domain-containing protein [Archaeoglobus neptunius]|uniref:DNA-binding protein n=1 Tax=Archaeoglobus neptunius TaxID=2798580 RepID=UPI0019251FF7|nr:DNA-binding protein [Archaeoglobus neptunius]
MIIDTDIVIVRVKIKEEISEDITAVTLVEYPKIIYYKKFYGKILFPDISDFLLAHKLQNELMKVGKPKAFADLVIASIRINRKEELITKDRDFLDIAEVSDLKVRVVE